MFVFFKIKIPEPSPSKAVALRIKGRDAFPARHCAGIRTEPHKNKPFNRVITASDAGDHGNRVPILDGAKAFPIELADDA